MASRAAARISSTISARSAASWSRCHLFAPGARPCDRISMATFDGIIIGGGHNGLTLGAYLTRAGLRVCVLERNAMIGGGCSTAEPALPGFRFNLHSNFYISWANAPLTRDLELWRYGFSTIEPPVQQGITLRDGTALTIHKDIEKSCASIARFSRRDADTY